MAVTTTSRPNVPLVMTDQQRWDTLSCVGGPVETANLDHIAATGTVFTRAAEPADDAANANRVAETQLAAWLSEHHERFAGTLTLTPPTFIAVMLDLVASLKGQGFTNVVIVNGHGGNVEALSLVARRARSELGVLVASMMWAKLARDVVCGALWSTRTPTPCPRS